MGAWNQPTILPYRSGFLEQITPSLLNFGTQLAFMKMHQNWQTKQAKVAATRATVTEQSRRQFQSLLAGAKYDPEKNTLTFPTITLTEDQQAYLDVIKPSAGPAQIVKKPTPVGWKPGTKAEAIEVKKAGLQPQAVLQSLETLVMPNGTEQTFRRGDPALDIAIKAGGVKRVVGRTEQDVIQKKEFQDLRAQEVATRDVLSLADELERAATQDPTILGMVGTSQRTIDRIANQMVATAKVLGGKALLNGKEVNEIELLNPEHYNLTGFGEAAAKSAGFRSTVLRLAYTIARAAEPGSGRFSDRDVQNAIDQIAGNQGSLSQLKAALNAVRRNTIISYSNRYKVTKGQEMPADMFSINIGQIQQPKIIRYDVQGNRIQ